MSGRNTSYSKEVARKKYAERQIKKWVEWTINKRGFMKYKELVELQEHYNIKVL